MASPIHTVHTLYWREQLLAKFGFVRQCYPTWYVVVSTLHTGIAGYDIFSNIVSSKINTGIFVPSATPYYLAS